MLFCVMLQHLLSFFKVHFDECEGMSDLSVSVGDVKLITSHNTAADVVLSTSNPDAIHIHPDSTLTVLTNTSTVTSIHYQLRHLHPHSMHHQPVVTQLHIALPLYPYS